MSEKYWQNKWVNRTRESVNNFTHRSYALIKDKNFKTLLEVGCGSGQDSRYFYRQGFKITALDFSRSGIAQSKARQSDIDYQQQDIRQAKFKSNSFDVIYAHLSLHYFDDRTTTQIFNKLHRWLKPGGYIFIKCKSTDDSLYGQGKKVGSDMYDKGHVRHFFSKEYMAAKLKQFKIIKIRKTSSTYHLYKSSFIEAVAIKQA
ncbi:MAG: class I SAM-dependent methyltransferase [Parcubacteria group bacterium]|nr:class I SAM-dependent methyltransferase [Parcubacteria group bacterium]